MKYILYWLNGNKELVEGNGIADAFSKAGYSKGALRTLDFYEDEHSYNKNEYNWNKQKRTWEKNPERIKDSVLTDKSKKIKEDLAPKELDFVYYETIKQKERYLYAEDIEQAVIEYLSKRGFDVEKLKEQDMYFQTINNVKMSTKLLKIYF